MRIKSICKIPVKIKTRKIKITKRDLKILNKLMFRHKIITKGIKHKKLQNKMNKLRLSRIKIYSKKIINKMIKFHRKKYNRINNRMRIQVNNRKNKIKHKKVSQIRRQ